ncbi:hypothetical protein EC968_005582 [Mortierella alpina]|nr:hypothetical protein EC968_005582 [Mortierella alpina]
MPRHWQDDTASGYAISTRVPCGDLAAIFRQDCSRKETDATLSFFGVHQDNTEQSIGESGSGLGLTSLWYSTLFDAPEPRLSLLQSSKPPQPPILQNVDASESALHLRQVTQTSLKPVARDTAYASNWDDLAHRKDGPQSEVKLLTPTEAVNRSTLPSTLDPRVPELVLVDADLWSKFHEQDNEMIITKSGRCLFPCLRFKAVGLDPTTIYTIYLDFELTDGRRFKFEEGRWIVSSIITRTDGDSGRMAQALARESYTHPDKYQTGAHWMKGTIFFDKVKLSNSRESAAKSARRTMSTKGAVGNSHHMFHMSSFHKYRPRVHLVQHMANSDAIASSTTYIFGQTSFIAVTHYQNNSVNDLKKGFNPHARGFRGSAGMSLSLPMEIEKKPLRSALRSKRTHTLKRRYCERDTSESDTYADADADMTESAQSSDDDDDLDSDISTLPDMTRTSSNETFEKSTNSLCRLNKDNRAMVSISISKGMIEAKRIVGNTNPPQQTKRLERKVPATLCVSRASRSTASHEPLCLKSIHATSANSTPARNTADRKQRIYKTRRLDSSSSRTQSSTLASTKSNSRCSTISSTSRVLRKEPQRFEHTCDIQETFSQLRASHSTPSSVEQHQNDAQHGPVVPPLAHDPPAAPPLSWYQQFVHWDQTSQTVSHQTVQRPILPAEAQSSEVSESCLLLPFTMDKDLDYVMLHRPPQTTPSQALPRSFVDVAGSVVQDAGAPDTPEISAPLGPLTPMVKSGTKHARSQVHIQVDEGTTSSQIQSNLTTTFTTILESRTLMSTTSDMATLPSSDSSIGAHLEHALRENLRLKAFIHARYGPEAEAEANAVMAMERRQ